MNIKKIIYYFTPVIAILIVLIIANHANLPITDLVKTSSGPSGQVKKQADAVLFTSGYSNNAAVFNLNELFFTSSNEIEIKKTYECALNVPAVKLFPAAGTLNTLILSADLKNIYLYDNTARTISEMIINKLKDTAANASKSSKEYLAVKSAALNQKSPRIAVIYENSSQIIVYDAATLRELFKIDAGAGVLPEDVIWNGDEIYFNTAPSVAESNAITICACKPPYSKVEKLGEYSMPRPYVSARLVKSEKVLKTILYNEFTGTLILFDHQASNFSIITNNMPPALKNQKSDNTAVNNASISTCPVSSLITWISDSKFAVIRGDMAKIFIFNENKQENELTLDPAYQKSVISAAPITINKNAGCLISSTTCDKLSLFDYTSQKIIFQKSLGDKVKIFAIETAQPLSK
ncbi:MAG: hypothetical protein QMC67_08205 [Candidatus Wallbacteria bacterium]